MIETNGRVGIDAHRRAGLWLGGYRPRIEDLTAWRERMATGTVDRTPHRHQLGCAPADSQAAGG